MPSQIFDAAGDPIGVSDDQIEQLAIMDNIPGRGRLRQRRRHRPRLILPGMPVPATAVTWFAGTYPGPLAINVQQWTMYELPAVDDHYWHDRMGFTVRALDASQDPARIDLEHDPAWEEELHDGLPDDCLAVGGRDSDDGTWHFQIASSRPGRRLPGAWSFGDDLETTIRQAVVRAAEEFAREQGA